VNWRPALPELVIAVVAVTAAALAGAAVAGWPGVVTVAVAAAAVAVGLLRAMVPRSAARPLRRAPGKRRARPVSGYEQRRFVVASSLASRPVYESELRPVLEHVLAARLAEHHAVNLYAEPEAARAAFCRTRGDARLWAWIDPARALDPGQSETRPRGIPRQALTRLIPAAAPGAGSALLRVLAAVAVIAATVLVIPG